MIDLYKLILVKVRRVKEMNKLAHVSIKSIQLPVDARVPKITEKKDQKKVREGRAALLVKRKGTGKGHKKESHANTNNVANI